MKFQAIAIPLFGAALVVGAWRAYGWAGVAMVGSGCVLWALLHFNRLLQVLQRAAHRPVGYVDSAVMLHARLRSGVSLLHVVAVARSLGELRSAQGEEPQVFRWTDLGQSHVTCEFHGGRLAACTLFRPEPQSAPDTGPTGAGQADSVVGDTP